MGKDVWVMKDEEGELRPQAFICEDGEGAKYSIENFQKSRYGKGMNVVRAKLVELK